jgi:hypothetical protein
LEVLTLECKIPESSLYCVPINIKAFDDRGASKPLVGTRSLSLTEFAPWLGGSMKSEGLPTLVDKIPGAVKKDKAFIRGIITF